MPQFSRGELVFDLIDVGPADGPIVVLLHGFPQFNDSWNPVITRLTAQGYRCLAPNQRGYSPGARPKRRRDYRISELIDDVAALIDASKASRVHLVGHDWGATVAWGVAARMPDKLASLSALSVPHPAAFMKALVTSRQILASWYIYFYQLPWFPEHICMGRSKTGRGLSKLLVWTKRTPEAADRDARRVVDSGALTAAINWYRGLPLSDPRRITDKIAAPTLYVWSDHDTGLRKKGAQNCGRYVSGEYRFETMHGVSHWIIDEQPDELTALLSQWFATHPQ